jgi:hypothetical protein
MLFAGIDLVPAIEFGPADRRDRLGAVRWFALSVVDEAEAASPPSVLSG